MKTKTFVLLALVSIFMFSCQSSAKKESHNVLAQNESHQEHPGKKLMETNCNICHSPNAGHDNRIAPPMVAVKRHYLYDGMSKAEFIKEMQDWIRNPIEENAKMKGAVRRFGVMPKQYYSEAVIKDIADYIYSENLEQPDWFEDHFNSNHQKGKASGKPNGQRKQERSGHYEASKEVAKTFDSYADQGLHYALATKAVLGKNLMTTIQNKGTIAAISFCNIEAYPLTDSMAVVQNAVIKRVSDQPRNIKNSASEDEFEIIKNFKSQLQLKEDIEPYVVEHNKSVDVFYPIITNSMCLQCHGKPNKDISTATLQKLSELYPNDLATGYDINQIRGIWKIQFEK